MSPRAGTCACGRTIVIRDDDEHPGVCDICHLQQALAAEREMLSTERRLRDKAEARAMLADAALNALSWLHQVAGGDGKASVADVESHVIKALRDTKSERDAAIERAERAARQAEDEIGNLRKRLRGAEAEVERLRGQLDTVVGFRGAEQARTARALGILEQCLPGQPREHDVGTDLPRAIAAMEDS